MKTTRQKWWKRSLSLLMTFIMLNGMGVVPVSAQGTGDGSNPVKWTHLYGGKGTNSLAATCDSINDVVTLTDGSYAAAGAFDGNGVSGVEGQKGKTDAAFLMYNKNGDLQKQTLVGGSKSDYFYKMLECAYGGFVAVGATQSEDGDLDGLLKGGYDGLLAKFDNQGNLEKIITVGGSSKDELRDIAQTLDGGYIAVGYTQSKDGDFAENGKVLTDRDAFIVKIDKDLNIEWIKTYGTEGTATTGLDDFYSVKVVNGNGYIAVGYSMDEENGNGKRDICIVRYEENGDVKWSKLYGGSGDEQANCITVSPYKIEKPSDDSKDWNVEILETGFAITGMTNSGDGIFSGSESDGVSKAFFMKIDPDGNIQTQDILENTAGASGESVVTIGDGYLVSGTFEQNDLGFTGTTVYGKSDVYVAHYSELGNFLNISSFGSDDNETVKGIAYGSDEDYILFGSTKSSAFYGNTLLGKYDGYLMSVNGAALETYAEEKYLIPVKAWKEDKDEPSMMSPLLYKDAYVEKTGDQYKVTVYFTNAEMMGTQVSASTLGSVSYEQNGIMVNADSDEYDILTQVKSSTITLGSISEPVKFYINGTMGQIRLVFDESNAVSTKTPPYFEPVKVTRPDFDCLWKTNVGGSDVDYLSTITTLKNGNIVIAGQTYSNDGDIAGRLTGISGAYINIYDGNGTLIDTKILCGANPDSSAYAASVDAASDGGFYICGGYQEGIYTEPSGSFEVLNTVDSVHGQIDGYYAKCDADGQLLWIRNFSGSAYDQVKQIKATDDGGCLVLVETNSADGDMQDLSVGVFDLVLIKCDKDGNKEWSHVISGSSMQSSSFGIAILNDGSYVVGGYAYLGYTFGDFENLTWYGNTFDLFAVKISPEGKTIWAKSYGGDGNDYCNAVTATSDGGFMIAGSTKSSTGTFENTGTFYENPFILKLDADGNEQWNDVLKSSEKGEAVKVVELGEKYIVLGSSYGTDFDFAGLNKGARDVFIAVYDNDGNRTFLDTIGGVNLDYASDIAITGSNQISIVFEGESMDGDLGGLNRGEFDGTLFTFKPDGVAEVNRTALEAALEEAEKIDNADGRYTELSFSVLTEAIRNARTAYADLSASQEKIDEQTNALNSAMEELVEAGQSALDKNNLKDGTYSLYAYMFKPNRKDYSMANNAINHKVQLEVINGEYYITMQLKGLSIYNLFGYLSEISYYNDGYSYDETGYPNGETVSVDILTTQKDAEGNDIIDKYNDTSSLYPEIIRFKLVNQAVADENGFVPMNVLVPIMETIAVGNGNQDVLMKLDWNTLKETASDEPGFEPEKPVEQSKAVDYTDTVTGVKIHADKGVFEEGVKIVVAEITEGADYEKAVSSLSDIGRKFKLYDVKFYNAQDIEIVPNGTVTISFPVAAEYDSENLAVYRLNDDGTKTLVKGMVENGYYTVIVRTAGKYSLMEKNSTVIDAANTANIYNDNVQNPQTGDASDLMVCFLLLSVSAGILSVLAFIRKRRISMEK